jgi:hypothetical protein
VVSGKAAAISSAVDVTDPRIARDVFRKIGNIPELCGSIMRLGVVPEQGAREVSIEEAMLPNHQLGYQRKKQGRTLRRHRA